MIFGFLMPDPSGKTDDVLYRMDLTRIVKKEKVQRDNSFVIRYIWTITNVLKIVSNCIERKTFSHREFPVLRQTQIFKGSHPKLVPLRAKTFPGGAKVSPLRHVAKADDKFILKPIYAS